MLTAKQRQLIKRLFRQTRTSYHHDNLAYRWALKQHITACTEDGQIAICRSGQDCDGVRYNSVRIVDAPKSVFAFMREEEDHREWLDGPENMWIEKPSDHNNENHYDSVDTYAERDGY